ncbi:MAG TPA: hypothetical protein GXX20_04175 [Clostridiaceae bacterium]|nr:hypothetical protein [Clostridiaceae bacterium]
MNGFYNMMNNMMNNRMPKSPVSPRSYRHGARPLTIPGSRPVKRIIEPERLQKPEDIPERSEKSREYADSGLSYEFDRQSSLQVSDNHATREKISPMDHIIKLDKESVVTGIIFSEILGKPRALRKHRSFLKYRD